MPHVPTPVTVPVAIHQRHHFIRRRTTVRRLRQALVDQPVQVRFFIPVYPAPKRAFANPEQSRRFFLRQPTLRPRSKSLFKTLHACLLQPLLSDQLPREVFVSLIEPNPGYAEDYRAWLETQPHLRLGTVLVAGLDEIDKQPQTSPDYGDFHLVLSLHMLYFVADPAASPVRMARFLAPGGALAVVAADEVRSYTGQVLRRFIEAGGDTGDNTASLEAVESRSRLLSGALRDTLEKEAPDARYEVATKRQPSRLYGHTLGDVIALANIGKLAVVDDAAKFEAAADLLRTNPKAVDLRIEDAGPRKGMWSVTQPQHLAIVRRIS